MLNEMNEICPLLSCLVHCFTPCVTFKTPLLLCVSLSASFPAVRLVHSVRLVRYEHRLLILYLSTNLSLTHVCDTTSTATGCSQHAVRSPCLRPAHGR